MQFETQKLCHDLNTKLKSFALCPVRILFLVFIRYTKPQNVFATSVAFFFQGTVAVILAFKPGWKMFKVLVFCKVMKVKFSFSVRLKQLWSSGVLNPHFCWCGFLEVGGNYNFSSCKREGEH